MRLQALLTLALLAVGCPATTPGESPGDTSPDPEVSLTEDAGVDVPTPEATDASEITDTSEETETAAEEDVPDVTAPPDAGPACDPTALSDLYTQYVEPFVSGAVLPSCSQCHMSGIDVSMYAQDTPCQTMACMVNLGAVDLDDPAASPLLAQILMGDSDSSVFDVAEEHEAMLEWITWSAQCHGPVCGEVSDACAVGTGAESTGVTPLGDCSEDDLLASFWDGVIIHRTRCVTCHSDYGQELGTFGPCVTADDCWGPQLCVDGLCHSPYPLSAPHFFEGGCTGEGQDQDCTLTWNNPAHKETGLLTMYNTVALGLVDVENPLDSPLLLKPLREDFQPLAIYGDDVAIESVPAGVGVGVYHGGSSKFSFGCHEPPCPTEGVVDCRTDTPCEAGAACGPGMACLGTAQKSYCRLAGSVCDEAYIHYIRFVQYYAQCKNSAL